MTLSTTISRSPKGKSGRIIAQAMPVWRRTDNDHAAVNARLRSLNRVHCTASLMPPCDMRGGDHMKEFLKTTIVGGLVFLLPMAVVGPILGHALDLP
jgi:hypothetical protein